MITQPESLKNETLDAVKKRLPEPIRSLAPVPKLVWLYIDQYPGKHSIRSLNDALGAHPVTALPELVAAGLLIEVKAPAGSRPGEYRTAQLPDEKPKKTSAPAEVQEEP